MKVIKIFSVPTNNLHNRKSGAHLQSFEQKTKQLGPKHNGSTIKKSIIKLCSQYST